MKVKVQIKYRKGYIPFRCSKIRYTEVDEIVTTSIKEVNQSDLNLKYSWDFCEHIDLYEYKNNLYKKAKITDICSGGYDNERYTTIIDAIKWWALNGSRFYSKTNYSENESRFESKEEILKRIKKEYKKYLIVDGQVYIKSQKPLYHICTFGLGNNHGGTGWMIVQSKYSAKTLNKNYKYDSYFEPYEYEKSYKKALEVASNRGDTNDVRRFNKYYENKENLILIFD